MKADMVYPIFLVHGMGFRDRKRLCYRGRIPKILEENGAVVYFGGQDSSGSVAGNVRQLKTRLEEVLAQSGAEKVNVIAHSKGGLEARYLISTMGSGRRGISHCDEVDMRRSSVSMTGAGILPTFIRVSRRI